MNDREPDPSRKSAYVLIPATSVGDSELRTFAATLGPQAPSYEQIRSSWWRRAQAQCAVAAIHEQSGAMVGLCGGRPSEWIIGGQAVPTVAICDWYVAPEHGGKLIGKRMVQHFRQPERMLYAISISDIAIAYLQRLGWVGPHASSLLAAPLPAVSGRALAWWRGGRLDFHDYVLREGAPLGPLGDALDRIEAQRTDGARAHMRRGSGEWAWRLSVCGDRSYHVSVAHDRAGQPVGYVVVRPMTPGRVAALGRRAGAVITDLTAAGDDPKTLRVLARRALLIAGELRAVVAVAVTTNPAQRRALGAAGFLSPTFPLIGPALARRAPVFMWLPKGPGAALTADGMDLTFADAAVDLDL